MSKERSTVMKRRTLRKFGDVANLPAGPDSDSTMFGDLVELVLSFGKAVEVPMVVETSTSNSQIICRICKGKHWTVKCPFKDTYQPVATENKAAEIANPTNEKSAYVPLHLRPGAKVTEASGAAGLRRDDANTIRISNLGEDVTEDDVRLLVESFGMVSRVYVARDHDQQRCKGFAFVTFFDRNRAEAAIAKLDGFGYDSLILQVDFARQ